MQQDKLLGDVAAMERQRPLISARAMLLVAVSTGIMTQTALRSVPNLVMNGERGMANEFNWLNAERGLILGSFGWGYTLTQLPGGVLSQLLGPRRTMFCTVLLGSAAGFAMPEGARVSFTVPMVLNFILGMAQGPVFPALKGLLAQWLRPSEMARGNAMMIASWNLGQVVQFLLSPLLLRTGSWPLAWYFYAACGVIWCWAWLLFAADTPEQHAGVGPAELAWIRRNGGNSAADTLVSPEVQQLARKKHGGVDDGAGEQFTCSVCQRIVTQKPVMVVSLCAGLDGLGGAFANWMPQYYNTQLKYNLEATGAMIALPLLVAMFSNVAGGLAADRVLARGVALSSVRRWFNLVPTLVMAACTLLLVWVRRPSVVVAIMATQNLAFGFKQAGIGPVTMELSRKYAAIMMGTYNCAQNLTYYALANNAIGLSLDRGRCPSDDLADPVTPEEQASCTLAWQELFALSSLITALSGVIFFLCGSADNIDHRIDRRPLENRNVVISSATGVAAGYSVISVPAAALGRPPAASRGFSNNEHDGSAGRGRARVAVDLSVEVGSLSASGYARLGA